MYDASSDEDFAAALKDSRAGNDVSDESEEDFQGALVASNALGDGIIHSDEDDESQEDFAAGLAVSSDTQIAVRTAGASAHHTETRDRRALETGQLLFGDDGGNRRIQSHVTMNDNMTSGGRFLDRLFDRALAGYKTSQVFIVAAMRSIITVCSASQSERHANPDTDKPWYQLGVWVKKRKYDSTPSSRLKVATVDTLSDGT